MIGLPWNDLTFLRGIRLDPPRAGMIAALMSGRSSALGAFRRFDALFQPRGSPSAFSTHTAAKHGRSKINEDFAARGLNHASLGVHTNLLLARRSHFQMPKSWPIDLPQPEHLWSSGFNFATSKRCLVPSTCEHRGRGLAFFFFFMTLLRETGPRVSVRCTPDSCPALACSDQPESSD